MKSFLTLILAIFTLTVTAQAWECVVSSLSYECTTPNCGGQQGPYTVEITLGFISSSLSPCADPATITGFYVTALNVAQEEGEQFYFSHTPGVDPSIRVVSVTLDEMPYIFEFDVLYEEAPELWFHAYAPNPKSCTQSRKGRPCKDPQGTLLKYQHQVLTLTSETDVSNIQIFNLLGQPVWQTGKVGAGVSTHHVVLEPNFYVAVVGDQAVRFYAQ